VKDRVGHVVFGRRFVQQVWRAASWQASHTLLSERELVRAGIAAGKQCSLIFHGTPVVFPDWNDSRRQGGKRVDDVHARALTSAMEVPKYFGVGKLE
jgi:hypothetical protein